MNLAERIEELGYHVEVMPSTLVVYRHGDFVNTFTRCDRRDNWRDIYGIVNRLNVKEKLKDRNNERT